MVLRIDKLTKITLEDKLSPVVVVVNGQILKKILGHLVELTITVIVVGGGLLSATYFIHFFKNGPFKVSFSFIFVFSIQLTKFLFKNSPMTGFKPRTSVLEASAVPTEPTR